MGKKKPYGKIALTVMLILMFVFVGTASALEQEFNPGFEDKKGTLGVDTKSWRAGWINSTFMEGPTSDAFHTVLSATDPTAINRVLLPDSSGTVALTGDISSTMALSNGTMLVGNASGLAAETSGTDTQMFIFNSTEGWGAKTLSGDVTITNAAVSTIGDNKIGNAELNSSVLIMNVASGVDTTTETVASGAQIFGVWAIANVTSELLNGLSITGTTLTGVLNKNAVSEVVFGVRILAP